MYHDTNIVPILGLQCKTVLICHYTAILIFIICYLILITLAQYINELCYFKHAYVKLISLIYASSSKVHL